MNFDVPYTVKRHKNIKVTLFLFGGTIYLILDGRQFERLNKVFVLI